MIFNYSYDIASTIIAGAVLFTFFRKQTLITWFVRAVALLILFVFLSSLFNVLSIISLNKAEYFSAGWLYFVNCAYFLTYMLIPLGFYYLVYFAGGNKRHKGIKTNILLAMPYLVAAVLILLTPFTRQIFYIDEAKQYHRGYLMFLFYLIGGGYVIFAIIQALIYRANFSARQKRQIILFPVLVALTVIIQQIFPCVQISGFALSISALMIYLSLENPSEFIDADMDVFNRLAFVTKFGELVERRRHLTFLGLSIVDLKYLNKTIGIRNEALLLENISGYLIKKLGKSNIYRVSRNVLILDVSAQARNSKKIAEDIFTRFENPFMFGDTELTLSIHMDMLSVPRDANNIDDVMDLLENSFPAQISLSEKNLVSPVDASIVERTRREHRIIQLLENAIKNDGFYIVFQPIYSVKKDCFTTVEILVRLKNQELGFVSPEEFIPIAEKNGMILSIGKIVLTKVCEFLSRNKIWEGGIEYCHINLSVIQCIQSKLYEELLDILNFYKINYSLINFEVTETSAIVSAEHLRNNMQELEKRNIYFALDDFGTGFSNSTTLINYPFKVVKIDKSLVWTAQENKDVRIILGQTISMIKDLEMKVVTEGVETEEQADMVKEMGTDFIQGFYYSRPLEEQEFLQLLSKNSLKINNFEL